MTHFRLGGIFYHHFVANSLLSRSVKWFLQQSMCDSYGKNLVAYFLTTPYIFLKFSQLHFVVNVHVHTKHLTMKKTTELHATQLLKLLCMLLLGSQSTTTKPHSLNFKYNESNLWNRGITGTLLSLL